MHEGKVSEKKPKKELSTPHTLAVIGAQWGDEGKGKMTDLLSQDRDLIVRFQGGNNAGHTIKFDGLSFALHLIPSGIFKASSINLLASGMVIDPEALSEELTMLEGMGIKTEGRLFIASRAHVILDFHKALDALYESLREKKIGTTHKGIGPAYMEKASRQGLKMATFVSQPGFKAYLDHHLPFVNTLLKTHGKAPYDAQAILKKMAPYQAMLRSMLTDGAKLIDTFVDQGKKVLFEGAQGTMLCLDHGTYPYVTSSSPSAAAIPLYTGVAPKKIQNVLGILKAYTTRVGGGSFPTEINNETADVIREKGGEFGTTTGRARRIGWLDTVQLRHAHRLNGFDAFALMLFDVLAGLDTLKLCTAYELDGTTIDYVPADHDALSRCQPVYETLEGFGDDLDTINAYDELSENAKTYVERIEALTGVPIAYVSTGPDRSAILKRDTLIAKTLKG
ncbi:MAG: adenylosuccinate synthase [Bacillota bacterium]